MAGLGVLGVVIDRVVPGSEAERVGLQGIDYRNRILGDIIVRAGNQEIKNIDDFIRILENCAIGQSIILDVRRDDQVRTVEVKIMDISVKLAKTSGNRMYISKLRVTLKELTESLCLPFTAMVFHS
ncbi:MAG: PDZ domain-containing protein [Desulfobacterales bacterium]